MNKKHLVLCSSFLLALTGCSATDEQGSGGNQTVVQQHASSGNQTGVDQLVVTDFAGRQLLFNHTPQRIVALGNGDMDIIYSLGGKLSGRPTSTDPVPNKKALQAEQIGTTHEMDLEKISFLKPDVVLGNTVLNAKDVPVIENIGSQMLLTNANSVNDILKQIRLFGSLLQKNNQAEELIHTIQNTVEDIQKHQSATRPRVLIVYGAPGTYMAALPNSLSGDILRLAGGDNIATDYPALENYPQYAQLNTERIVQSNPQLILIMTHGNPEAVKSGFLQEMKVNAAWSSMSAVQNGHVQVLPSSLFGTNPGTRVTEALNQLHGLLEDVT